MNIYSYSLLFVSIVNVFLAFFALRRERNKMTLSYFAFMICIVFYSFGYAFELTAKNLSDIIFWLNIEYIGISFFTPIYLLFTLYFVGKDKIITIPFVALIFSISIVTFVIHFVNFNHLFIDKYDVINQNGFLLSDFKKGIWYWIHQAYFNSVVLISAFLFAQMMFNSRGLNQIRAAIMLFNTLLPWPFYLIYLMGYGPAGIDISAFSLSLVGLIGSIGLIRFDLLNFVPIALSQVFESMKDAVLILDKEKNIINLNESACHFLSSISKSKVDGNSHISLDSYPQLVAIVDQKKYSSSIDIDIEINEVMHYYLASVSFISSSVDSTHGYILTLIDITERKRVEKLLLENENKLIQLNKAKDKFYALIAHDLRNPFNSLLNLSLFLRKSIENGDTEKSLRLADAFNISAQNGYALLQNLLDWAKIQQGVMLFNPVCCFYNELIENELCFILEQAKQKKISIQTEIEDSLTIYADDNMLRTILRNMLNNAIKYSYENKSIVIKVYKDGFFIKTSVIDTGIGIQHDDIASIFSSSINIQKTGTNNERGTGFGLKLCKELVAMHNGEVGVESILGEGSAFWFTIPIK